MRGKGDLLDRTNASSVVTARTPFLWCGCAQDIVEELSRNELSKEQYPYVKLPEALVGEGTVRPSSAPARKVPHSVRTIRYNWAANSERKSVVDTSRYSSLSRAPWRNSLFVFFVLISARQRSSKLSKVCKWHDFIFSGINFSQWLRSQDGQHWTDHYWNADFCVHRGWNYAIWGK